MRRFLNKIELEKLIEKYGCFEDTPDIEEHDDYFLISGTGWTLKLYPYKNSYDFAILGCVDRDTCRELDDFILHFDVEYYLDCLPFAA